MQKIEGKGRLEEEGKMLKRLNLGDDPARRTRGRRNASRIPPSPNPILGGLEDWMIRGLGELRDAKGALPARQWLP